jgi:hypothetical protein
MSIKIRLLAVLCAAALGVPAPLRASSHMDAPLITLDPAANTTDVYAFRSAREGVDYLTAALAVYPFEEPGIGPNKYNFDDNVRYEIHVALGDDLPAGRATLSYRFEFTTRFKNEGTILQSYLGVIENVDDDNQNLTQTYTVTKLDHRTSEETVLGTGAVPPNNQGIATPRYNQDDNGENPAKAGVATEAELDLYTTQAISSLNGGYQVFAGQRDDGFYADIQAIFDLLQLRNPGRDAQGGYNVHTIVLNVPLDEVGGPEQVVGVYATTSRPRVEVANPCVADGNGDRIVSVDELVLGVNNALEGCPNVPVEYRQVGRQGNPLFNEGLVAIADKDRYSRTSPEEDEALFSQYALEPELARLLNLIVFRGNGPAVESDRTDIAGIFIPDLIKVDLSTGPARLAGGGPNHPTNPDDEGFSRLSVFGGDALVSMVQSGLPGFPAGTIPGGWPNGRRFGDDVVDIAVTALISDLRGDPLIINGPAGDNVDGNEIAYNKVFPYAATPLNGRAHGHHGDVR